MSAKIDYTPRAERNKKEEVILTFKPCCVCGKAITTGYYARWGNGGTCTAKCESIQELAIHNFGDNHETATRVNSFSGPIFRSR